MGYYKDQNIEHLQKIFDEEQESILAEKAAASYLQPFLSQEFSDYPEADSLLDFVEAFNQRKALMAKEQIAKSQTRSQREKMQVARSVRLFRTPESQEIQDLSLAVKKAR